MMAAESGATRGVLATPTAYPRQTTLSVLTAALAKTDHSVKHMRGLLSCSCTDQLLCRRKRLMLILHYYELVQALQLDNFQESQVPNCTAAAELIYNLSSSRQSMWT